MNLGWFDVCDSVTDLRVVYSFIRLECHYDHVVGCEVKKSPEKNE